MTEKGKFIISLDFELFWGVRDIKNIENYGESILGVQYVLPRKLELFEKYNIRSTIAVVGLLFASNKEDIARYSPKKKPEYRNPELSPYNGYHKLIGNSEKEDKYHYANGMINNIRRYPQHEIATHTFSHFYCLEEGQTIEDFTLDLLSALKIAKDNNLKFETIIFPRNQFNEEYLQVCRDIGITSFRGTVEKWFYNAKSTEIKALLNRLLRFVDAYLNLSGHNCYSLEEIAKTKPYNIPSSRFFRPYSKKLKHFEKLRIRRIKKSMTYAAQRGLVYHLWWHPHNFGINQKENLSILEEILSHYDYLNSQYEYESITMRDLSKHLSNRNN